MENDDFDDEVDDDDLDEVLSHCGLDDEGQCSNAGTEHCDFECPMRDSDQFCGSAAWHEKHRRKASTPQER